MVVEMNNGLPPSTRAKQLRFDAPTETLILEGSRRDSALSQLYFRRCEGDSYQGLSDVTHGRLPCEGEFGVVSWILSPDSSIVLLLARQGTPVQHTSSPVGDRERRAIPIHHIGLFRIQLADFGVDAWGSTDLDADGRFVSDLVGAEDGQLYAVIGVPSPGGLGPVTYSLARLKWSTRTVHELCTMPNIFF